MRVLTSPHQHGNLTGGFATGPFAIEGEVEEDEVDGGMIASLGGFLVRCDYSAL